jgi:hypothetical protein
MTGIFGERVTVGQANGPDVELVVRGDEWYASYESPAGYAAVYDDTVGLFCYGRLENGRLLSTGTPITSDPPRGLEPHLRESDAVRTRKAAEREAARARGTRSEQP